MLERPHLDEWHDIEQQPATTIVVERTRLSLLFHASCHTLDSREELSIVPAVMNEQLFTTLGGRYSIERELGGGGIALIDETRAPRGHSEWLAARYLHK